MTASCRQILEACVTLSAQQDIAALRESFCRIMGEIVSARSVLMMGLDATGESLLPLASSPEPCVVPGFNVFESERNEHPVSIALRAQGLLTEPPEGQLLMASLREILFSGEPGARLVIIAAPSASGRAETIFFALTDAKGGLPAADAAELAVIFARFCDARGRSASSYLQMSDASTLLSRSLENADKERKRMRRTLPEALSGKLVGTSAPMRQLRDTIAKYGPVDLSILILGETGTGKELAARELHRLSDRSRGPFIAINMAALPETLAESEFFGHVKGAFTGAQASRAGYFASAHGGTLFLDEIGDMPLALQAKLLRVLQDKVFRPIGSDTEHRSDFRIIAATHRDLHDLMRRREFREDLFYRIGEARILIPPLRERSEDIAGLAAHFLNALAQQHGQAPKRLSEGAKELLASLPFAGNVRELQAMMTDAWLTAGEAGEIAPEHLPPMRDAVVTPAQVEFDAIPSGGLKAACEAFERKLLVSSFRAARGNTTQIAERLRLPRRTLVDKLKKYGIEKD
ncbi:sigma-54 interaction domain-containing protein [Phyllobacterium leguminum]|uniref:Sigma-54-specific transcriptional regulator n=1 Tax=Phyllobacterium leguminum TaxID=314237 RepID=A0A318SUK2_9HYPH|nr:sigma-54 dependent transcriptional regulator [Phyllobacterium leguminum]PYE85152.1 sigma-54-specific transcriptional regulator [Phyllobacterium leguminum]